MLYNLSARENGAGYFLFAVILSVIPRFGINRKVYTVSVVLSILSAFMLILPVYRTFGWKQHFNYSEWFVYNSPSARMDTLLVVPERGVKALYYPPTNQMDTKPDKWCILLHGGGFTGGSASHMSHLGYYFSGKNIPAFSLDYSLAPNRTFPIQVREIDSLISKVRAEYNFDSFSALPFFILGESAGGTIALNYAAMKPDAMLLSVVNLYGITDSGFIHPESLESNANLPEMIDAYRGGVGVDPMSALRNAVSIKVPVYTFHGTDDVIVPVYQARAFHEKRTNLGYFNDRLFVLPGATHLFDHPLSGPSGQFLKQRLEEIIINSN